MRNDGREERNRRGEEEGRGGRRGEEYWKERKGEKMGRMITEDGRGEYSIRYII